MTHKVCCNCFCGFCVFFGFCSFCSCCGFYGVCALVALGFSSPFGVVLVRWLFAVSWFLCFFPLWVYMHVFAKGINTWVSTSVLTCPFPCSENSISGHLLKFIVQLFLLDLCFTTNNQWGKRGAQFFIWTYMEPIGKPKQMNGISEEIQFHIAFIWVYLS